MEELAKTFTKLEIKLKEMNALMKTMREEKEATSEMLKTCMNRENIECIQIDGHNIVLKNLKQYGPLNQEYLENTLSEFCNKTIPQDSKVFAEKAAEHLISNRETTEKQVVRLLKSKK
jgi:hypothetical protein